MTPPPDGFEPLKIQNGFALAFGPILARREGDRVSLGFRVDERHVNIGRVCHGGALATFADLQLAAMQRTGAVEMGHYPTISLSVDFLAAAALHDWVEYDVTLLKRTRRLVFTQAVLRTEAGPIARSNALYSAPSGSPAAGSWPPPISAAADEPNPPEGFEPIGVGPGFGANFGPVFARPETTGVRTLGFRVAEKHINIFGACHGGATATFADSQIAALRLLSVVPPGHCKTISLSIDYLGPARLGDWVESDVTLVRATRRFLFTQAILSTAGEPIARATAIYATPRPAA